MIYRCYECEQWKDDDYELGVPSSENEADIICGKCLEKLLAESLLLPEKENETK